MTQKVLRVLGRQTRTFRPPWAESTICDITIGNFYVFSGTDGLSRNKRENILAEVIPRILIKKPLGIWGGDLNSIIDKKDAKMSPSCRRLVSTFV